MKSYTDISQSKKLAKILPLESADMCYLREDGQAKTMSPSKISEILNVSKPQVIPCWSLAALLSVLPYCPDLSKHTDGKWYITTYPNGVHTCLMAYDSPVDACYELILKLHELNLL